MVQINWNDYEESGDRLRIGLYRAVINKAEFRNSQKGDMMFNIALMARDFDNRHLTYDAIMLSGRGTSMGVAKLKAIFDTDWEKYERSDIQEHDLVGRPVFVSIVEGTREKAGKKYLEVELSFDDPFMAGYVPFSVGQKLGLGKKCMMPEDPDNPWDIPESKPSGTPAPKTDGRQDFDETPW